MTEKWVPVQEDFVARMQGAIVLGTDGSASSLQAAQHAVDLARRTGAPLLAIYVVDSPMAFRTGIHYGMAMKELRADGERALEQVEGMAQENDVNVVTMMMVGKPGTTVGRIADLLRARLLVLGSSKSGWLWRLLRVSTTADVLKNTRCPVYITEEGLDRCPWRQSLVGGAVVTEAN